jgi:hypothetical protein
VGAGAGRRRERGSAAGEMRALQERETEVHPPTSPPQHLPHPTQSLAPSQSIFTFIKKRSKKHFFFRSECTVNNVYLVRFELTIFNGRLTLVLGGATKGVGRRLIQILRPTCTPYPTKSH